MEISPTMRKSDLSKEGLNGIDCKCTPKSNNNSPSITVNSYGQKMEKNFKKIMHELRVSPEIICGLQCDFPDFSSTWINTADSL